MIDIRSDEPLIDSAANTETVDMEKAAMAASCDDTNYCSLECEKYILRSLDVEFDERQMLADAVQRGWQKKEGTALHNVGRNLESKGLLVTIIYHTSAEVKG